MASESTDPDADRPGPGGAPEGHTPEKPADHEYGKLGTPAAALSPDMPHAADADGVGHADEPSSEHADEAEPLGPIDWRAWGASVLGIAVAVLIGLALALPNLPR